MHVGEAEVAARMPVGEALVVEAQQMEQRGVQVVHVHRVLLRVVAVVVGAAVGEAWLHAAAGEEVGEPMWVVIAAGAAFAGRRASEFAAPPDERVFEHPALLEIGQQRCNRLIDLGGVLRMVRLKVAVLVPLVAVGDLHEAHAALEQSPRHHALATEVLGPFVVEAIERFGRFRLVVGVERLARLHLHAEREFERRDARAQRRILLAGGGMFAVDGGQ